MPYPFTSKIDDQWTSGDQPVPVSNSSQLWTAGLSVLPFITLARLGNRRWGQSQKLGWDYIVGAARHIEEYSPGHIFRTFQISHALSPLEDASRVTRFYTPTDIGKLRENRIGLQWLENLGREVGDSNFVSRVGSEGFRFENGQLLLGDTNEVLLKHASIVRSPTNMSAVLQEARARSIAGGPVENLSEIFKARIPYQTFKEIGQEAHTIIGGQSRLQQIGRLASGYGTSLVERMNQLARSPAELPVISGMFESLRKLPGFRKFHLDVVPSSGLKTLAKLTGKLGLVGTAAYYAYQEVDYRTRKSSLFDNTILDEGITAAAATVWTRGQVQMSKVAAATGLHSYREKQEEIAPGSTEISKLMALPILGGLGGVGIGYAQRLHRQIGFQRAGLDVTAASLAATAQEEFFKANIYNRVVSPEVLSTLDKETISTLTARAAEGLSGNEGRAARWIAAKSKRRTIGGAFLRTFGEVGPTKLKWIAGLAAGTALVAPFIPGALVPSDRPEKLEALYSGKEKEVIRKGSYWEFGRSLWQGTTIDRFQEHWYPRMLARAKEKSIWGEDAPGPLKRWFIENFTYELEKKFYKDRPYPLTSGAFEDVPFLGPLLSATVGKLIKPPRYMHVDEWMREGPEGAEFKEMPAKYQEVKLPGELGKGAPISPYSIKGVLGEEAYRMQEMVGLPGFTMASLKERFTGVQDLFAQEAQLESANKIFGAEREYWDMNLGGALGLSELPRRLYPHRRRQIEQYNPIENTAASWLPGAGDRSPDFRHGDPFAKIPLGESRLPGTGYAALHPELKGIDPEDYPLMHRFKILADVAPYSKSYGQVFGQVKSMAASGELSPEEISDYHQTVNQIAQRKTKKVFSEFQYREKNLTPVERLLAASNEEAKSGDESKSWFAKTLGSYWETMGHAAETPAEFLTPVSPGAKLLHMRTAIEDYEKTQVFGTDSAFWEHPIRDFLKPALQSTMHMLGSNSIPGDVQDRRELEEYFDLLKYVKHTRLKQEAVVQGDMQTAAEMEGKRRETLFGVNPFTFNFAHIMRALPRRERDYFSAFSDADVTERSDIFNMIPENEQALYLARWKMKDADNLQVAVKKGLLNEEQVAKAEAVSISLQEEKSTEGLPKDKELWVEYLATRTSHESYPDWYRRTKLLEKKLAGRQLPGPDWVGFCLPAGQEILVDNKFLNIEKVKIGMIANQSLEGNQVLQTMNRYVKEEDLVSLATSISKNEKMVATKEHLVLAAKPEKCKYKRVVGYKGNANNRCLEYRKNNQCKNCNYKNRELSPSFYSIGTLEKNDYLVFRRPNLGPILEIDLLPLIQKITNFDKKLKFNEDFIWWYYNDKRNAIKRKIVLDYRMGFLLGIFTAEGHITYRKESFHALCFTHNLNEKSIALRIEEYIHSVFSDSIKCTIFERYKDTGNSLNTRVNNPLLSLLFSSLGGRISHDKYLRHQLLPVLNKDFILGFVSGSLFGDGGKTEETRIILECTSLLWINQLRIFSYSLGFVPTIQLNLKKKEQKTKHKINIQVSNRKLFYSSCWDQDWEYINALAKESYSSKKFIDNNFIYYQVTNKDFITYTGLVYDLSIDKKQEYECSVGIYHNCPAVDLEDVKMKIVKDSGASMYDYDLWPDRLRAITRRPQIAPAAEALQGSSDPEIIRTRITDLLAANNIDSAQISLLPTGTGESNISITAEEDRSKSDREYIRKRGVS